jgi:hypothetical protein
MMHVLLVAQAQTSRLLGDMGPAFPEWSGVRQQANGKTEPNRNRPVTNIPLRVQFSNAAESSQESSEEWHEFPHFGRITTPSYAAGVPLPGVAEGSNTTPV